MTMTLKHLTAAFFIALSALFTVGIVGRSREPITPTDAVVQVVVNSIMIWLVLS